MSIDLGKLINTTEDAPEGTGATFTPSIFNLGASYSYLFENKVSVGVTAKFVTESIANAGASAMALDAGVQYVTGEHDNFKFGISLRNVGGKMRFTGEGLTTARPNPGPTFSYNLSYFSRGAAYELPSQLNIGMSYDWILGQVSRLSMILDFTSNAFSRDQAGVGLEYTVAKFFAVRAAYKMEFSTPAGSTQATIDDGFAGGFSFSFPVKKDSETRLGIDYSYRNTAIYQGIHSIGLRLSL